MRKIGAGLQFNIYDLGNGRVLKTNRTKLQMYFTNLLWQPYLIFAPWILKRKIDLAQKYRNNAIKYFSTHKYKKSLLANLEIKNKKTLQDKVIPIIKIIGKNFEKDKKLIDNYGIFLIKCWKEGFADTIYNFTVNNGVDKNNNIVLIDFGEITTNKKDVEKAILSKRWKRAACYKRRIRGKTKKYYKKQMEEFLTIKNLNKYWINKS
jgi:hypothetical protein